MSSFSQSTKSTSRRRSIVAAADPPAAKRAKRTTNATEGKGSSQSVEDADDGGDKYDDEDDIIPATDGPVVNTAQDIEADIFIAQLAAELIEKHRHEFMKRTFSVRTLAADVPLTTASASIKMCRPQKDIDYIIYVLKNWRVGVNIKLMDPCPERASISKFRKANHNGAMYAKQYCLEEIVVPGSDTLAQYSDAWRRALWAEFLCPESRCSIALTSGTETMVTWVRRGLGGIAKKNTTLSPRLLSSITARPALLA